MAIFAYEFYRNVLNEAEWTLFKIIEGVRRIFAFGPIWVLYRKFRGTINRWQIFMSCNIFLTSGLLNGVHSNRPCPSFCPSALWLVPLWIPQTLYFDMMSVVMQYSERYETWTGCTLGILIWGSKIIFLKNYISGLYKHF